MKIRTKVYVLLIIFILIWIGFTGGTYFNFLEKNRATEVNVTATKTIQEIFELNILVNDYRLLNKQEKALKQWRLQYRVLGEVISPEAHAGHKHSGKELILLQEMRKDYKDFGEAFSQYEQQNISKELESRLISQLLVKSQFLVSDSFELSNLATDMLLKAQARDNYLILISLVLFFTIILTIVYTIHSAILTPIHKLHKGIEIISSGNLDYKVATTARNEVGQLSRAFDQMTENLKNTTTSVKKLNQEITERKNAEEALAKSYAGLEDKVRERTHELKEKYDELVQNQTAMLYMVEDLNMQAKELKEAQEKLVRSEKLAIVGQLASSVAHELRNPLGVMKNAIYYLNMLELGKDNPDIKENLGIISAEIENSDKVISDLLEFSRIKQPALKPEDVNSIIKETLNRIKVPAGTRVVTELGENLPQIQADALQMQLVFVNLAANAIQAIEKGGILTVSSCVTHDKNIAIVFKDTGCGIPKENLQKIFEPLFSTKTKGTGLGLSVVASLVEGHGGKIEIESEAGKGSIFTVKLPIR